MTPPISKTAGFVVPTEEVGELAAGEVAGELVEDIFATIVCGTINDTKHLTESRKTNV